MLSQFMISLVRQAVALYKRGYRGTIKPLAWAVVGQAAYAEGNIPRDQVTQEQYFAWVNALSSEFTGTPLKDQLLVWPPPENDI